MTKATSKPSEILSEEIIKGDIKNNKNDGRVHTRGSRRSPGRIPHPGHTKSICLNFRDSLSEFKGLCNLRFDDTNRREEVEYVESIKEDVKWLRI